MNLFQKVRKGNVPIQTFAGLADSSYVKKSCMTGKEDLCSLYLGSTAAFAYLTTVKAGEPTVAAEFIARSYVRFKEDKKYKLAIAITPKITGEAKRVLDAYATHIEYFSDIVTEIDQRINKIRLLNKSDASYEEELLQLSTELSKEVVSAIEEAIKMVRNDKSEIRFAQKKDDKDTQELIASESDQLKRIHTISDVVSSIQSKRYSSAMADMTRIWYCISEESLPDKYSAECMPWNDLRESVQKRLTCAGAKNESAESNCQERVEKQRKALDAVTRYTPVAAEIAGARTTEELNQALDRAASPVGAWRLKRNRPMASFGGLVGWTFGRERLSAPDGTTARGRYSALFAPVGLDLSTPIRNTSWTAGVFISVIDVGNLLSFNTSQSEAIQVKEDSHATFRDIYSPGIYGRIGLGRTPLVLGFGVAKTPGLRTADLGNGNTAPLDSVRVSAFLAMDITLFPF